MMSKGINAMTRDEGAGCQQEEESHKVIAALPKEEAVVKDSSIIQDVRFSRSEAAPESEEPTLIAPVH